VESDEEIRRVSKMGSASTPASSGAGADERPKEYGKEGRNLRRPGRSVAALRGTRSRTG